VAHNDVAPGKPATEGSVGMTSSENSGLSRRTLIKSTAAAGVA
jgi:hypothetical protein